MHICLKGKCYFTPIKWIVWLQGTCIKMKLRICWTHAVQNAFFFFFFFFWKSTCLYLEQRADKLDWEVTKAQSLWSPRAGMMKWGTLCFQRQRQVFKKRCWRHFETNRAGCANKLLAFVRWETISPDKKPFQKEILLVLSNKQGRLRKTKRCLCNHKVNLCEVRNHLTRKETAFLKCANVFKNQRKKNVP